MPKYKMAVQISGTRDGQDWPEVGALVDLPEDEAVGYLAAGLIVDPASEDAETATAPEPETATTRRGRGSVKAAAAAQDAADDAAPESAGS